MELFLTCYCIIAVIIIASVFVLSLNESKSQTIKTVLTVVYFLAIIGVVYGMVVLEGHYQLSRLTSSGIAACAVGLMYLADTLGAKLRKKKEETQ